MTVQMSMVDAFLGRGLGSNEKLSRIDAQIDWDCLGALLSGVRAGVTGRPPYDALSMVKALYLQALYDLSDPGLEEALLDRLSFRRFCGFALDGGTPDETTICRFRSLMAESGALERCFEEVNRQLEARGLILKKGTLLDASLIQATHKPPSGPGIASGATHPREPGADWTKKDGKAHFGYRYHIAVDEKSGLIRRGQLHPARVQDTEIADALILGDEAAVYADRAYGSHKRTAALKAAGIKDRIMHRRHKSQPKLPHWKAVHNRLISKVRAPVEAVFSAAKRLYGMRRTRCFSLKRNAADFTAFATIYNLRRVSIITQ